MLVDKAIIDNLLKIVVFSYPQEVINANYNPNQKRDNKGRWTKYSFYEQEYKSFRENIVNFAKLSEENNQYNGYLDIGAISPYAQKEAMRYSIDLSGYIHNIDAKAIRHRNNGHKNTISDEDLKLIPEIIYNPDEIIYYKRKQIDHINYKKKISTNEFIYIEEVRSGKKYLTTKTIYKKDS